MVQFDIDDIFSTSSDPMLDFPYDQIDSGFSDSSMGLSPESMISNTLDFEDELFKELSSLSEDSEREEMCDPSTFLNSEQQVSVKREVTSPKPCPLTSALLSGPTPTSHSTTDSSPPDSVFNYTGTDFLNEAKPPALRTEITKPRATGVPYTIKSEPSDTKSYRSCMRSDRSFKIYIPAKRLSSSNVISVNIKKENGGEPDQTNATTRRPKTAATITTSGTSNCVSEAPRTLVKGGAGRSIPEMVTAEKAYTYYSHMKNFKTESGGVRGRRAGRCPMSVPGHLQTEEEVRNWKKQQRMLKNRESACLSRRRKKEYVTTIESKLTLANQHGAMLASENNRLRKDVESFRSENKVLREALERLNQLVATLKKNNNAVSTERSTQATQPNQGSANQGSENQGSENQGSANQGSANQGEEQNLANQQPTTTQQPSLKQFVDLTQEPTTQSPTLGDPSLGNKILPGSPSESTLRSTTYKESLYQTQDRHSVQNIPTEQTQNISTIHLFNS